MTRVDSDEFGLGLGMICFWVVRVISGSFPIVVDAVIHCEPMRKMKSGFGLVRFQRGQRKPKSRIVFQERETPKRKKVYREIESCQSNERKRWWASILLSDVVRGGIYSRQ